MAAWSGAGANRVGSNGAKTILTTSASSADSGAQMLEAKAFRNWGFQLSGTFTGYSVTVYGTFDYATAQGNAANWFPLPAPAVEGTGDTNTWTNPLTTVAQGLYCNAPLIAVRAVATGTSQTGTVNVLAFALE